MTSFDTLSKDSSQDSENIVDKLMELTYILSEYDMSKQINVDHSPSYSLFSNLNPIMNTNLNSFNVPSLQSQHPFSSDSIEMIAQSMFRDLTWNKQDISNNNYQPIVPSLTSLSLNEVSTDSSKESANNQMDKCQESVRVKSSAHVSYIVGKQGAKIRQIRHETDTLIQTPVNGEEPVFVLKGRKKNVNMAKERILEGAHQYDMSLFVEAVSYNDGNKKQLNLLLPPRFIGLVVGKKGAVIKRIMEQCGAKVVTPKVNTLNGFKVFGTNEQIQKAVHLIKHHIEINSKVTIMEVDKNDCEIELLILSKQ